jgi:diaminohydroxyphosphoribosylaminopyrimidine deaminase/5-amino-6-(5-phosphoribosylamino)uracil reductase
MSNASARLKIGGSWTRTAPGTFTATNGEVVFTNTLVDQNIPSTTFYNLTIDKGAKTATATGESQWITGEAARAFGHLMRARNDAILIGVGTALADDPMLTCRLPGLEDRSPVRVVLDTTLRLTERSQLARTARDTPTLVFTTAPGGEALKARGVEVIQVDRDAAGRPRLDAVLTDLAARGITRLLVEGGATVHAAFLDSGLADRLEVFTSPMVLGGAGQGAVDALAALTLDEAPRFNAIRQRSIGPDLLVSYARGD